MASSKNIADQVASAVQNAVNSSDFSGLQSTIERAVGSAAESIGRGIAQATDGIRRGQEQYALIQERKRQEELMSLRYANPASERGGGVALVVAGGVVALPLIAVGLLMAIANMATAIPFVVGGAALGAALTFAGTRKLRLAAAFDRYRNAIGLRESCSVKELAQGNSDSAGNVVKNVRKMLAKGMFKQAALDEDSGLLLMTPEAYERHERELAAASEAKRQRDLANSTNPGKQAPLTAEQQRLLDRPGARIAHEQHEHGVFRREGGCREVVKAVVEHARRRRGQDLGRFHERGAVYVERAQVGRRLVERELQPLAVEVGVAFLRDHEPALAFAVRDEQLHLHERLAALGAFGGAASLGHAG